MNIIASGVPYRNYRYRVQPARVLRRRGLMGLSGPLVDAAQAKVDAIQGKVSQITEALTFAKTKYDPKYGSTETLDWSQLPPNITGVPDTYSMRVEMVELARKNLDRIDLQAIVDNPNAPERTRLAAWFALRVWPIYGGVSGVFVTIRARGGPFFDGVADINYDENSPEEYANWVVRPLEHQDPRIKKNWAYLEGRLFGMGMAWAKRGGIPQRQDAIQKLTSDLAVANSVLAAAQSELSAARTQEASTTSGGSTQTDVDRINREREAAEKKAKEEAARAKMYMMLGIVGVVAVGGFFWWKSHR